jgi:DNA-binding transcriptional regulator LsrR (DeoR family)
MNIHKNTRLTPVKRKELYDDYHTHHIRKCDLVIKYGVSRPTINKILHRGRIKDFTTHKSTNKRFTCLKYGLKRLAKIEEKLQERLRKRQEDTTRNTLEKCFTLIPKDSHF